MIMGLAASQPVHLAQGLQEYLLIARPDAFALEQLMSERKLFASQFQRPQLLQSEQHICIAAFLLGDQMEPTFIRWMHRALGETSGFSINISSFGAAHKHTIYLRIENQQPFTQLAKTLEPIDRQIRSFGSPGIDFNTNVHLPFVARLDDATYQAAAAVYAEKKINTSFDIKELVLVKRRDAFDACRQVTIFRLQDAVK
jgi:hypothetical protein